MGIIKEVAEDFLALFFPSLCLCCGENLVHGEDLICIRCLLEIKRTDYHLTRDNALEQLFWGRCMIERGASYSVYNRGSRIRKLIHLMKYRGAHDIGFILGKIYGSYLRGTSFMEGVDLLVPVPLHPSRLKDRGYNQSEYIAGGISAVTGVPVDSSVLIRSAKSETQTRRRRYERWENVDGLFIVKMPDSVKGRHVMLVDDVITTGSTMEACANALQKCEGVKISVVALAVSQRLTI